MPPHLLKVSRPSLGFSTSLMCTKASALASWQRMPEGADVEFDVIEQGEKKKAVNVVVLDYGQGDLTGRMINRPDRNAFQLAAKRGMRHPRQMI